MKTFTKVFFVFLTVLAFSFVCSCGGDDDENEEMSSYSFVTYNAGLAVGYVDYAPERLPKVGNALGGFDADVICMQEVWTEEQALALIDAAKAKFPYSYYKISENEFTEAGEAACTAEETAPLEVCVEANCAEVEAANIATCVLANCEAEFGAVSGNCSSCVIANIGNTVEQIMTTCKTPGKPTGKFAYDGHNGLLMLSKYEMTATDDLVFDSYANRRVVLSGAITLEALGKVNVFCTHLTANLSDVAYNGDYESWGDEQAMQITGLIDYVTKTADGNPAVVMGDMNCGPETGNVVGELVDNYAMFGASGMSVPYTENESSVCSWCAENPLTGDTRDDHIIDQVMFKNMPEEIEYESSRVFDKELEIESNEETMKVRLSDHYGVMVKASI